MPAGSAQPSGTELPARPIDTTIRRFGSFRFFREGQRWEWSAEVANMHGYEDGKVVPTTELVLEHKHPDDRSQVGRLIRRVLDEGVPFCSRHRITDAMGRIHNVIVVADRMLADDGTVTGTQGFYVDVTEAMRVEVDAAVLEVGEHRAPIEQAKGMLMLIYGITEQHAFDILVWRSQETNIKLRVLAEQLVSRARELRCDDVLRRDFDHLLLTAHEL
ncbi:ANTAR domain-containing protein [Skermania sp. ID1734]|uniref:PAS and ANTAR domain-containing protein n=1 Tax=Skermania sp. ID1734 TaxID=2597516 RepID=UPI00117D31EC|nr:PAS and ANTAR domain-containing protein [Skermania sp. ID1734]TSD99916.1 ANTAR domain-containing protein [Skermania sp. ID1734]